MKKRKNATAKIMAGIALLAIVLGIIGTGILVIASSFGGQQSEISQEELQQYIESLSGSLSPSEVDEA